MASKLTIEGKIYRATFNYSLRIGEESSSGCSEIDYIYTMKWFNEGG